MSLFNPSYTTATALVKTQDNTFDFSTLLSGSLNGTPEMLVPNLKNNDEIGVISESGSNYTFTKYKKSNEGNYFIKDVLTTGTLKTLTLGTIDINKLSILLYGDFVIYSLQDVVKSFYVANLLEANKTNFNNTYIIDSFQGKIISVNMDNKDNIYFEENNNSAYKLYSSKFENIIEAYNPNKESPTTFTNVSEFSSLQQDSFIFNPIIENSYYYTKGDNKFYKSDDDAFIYDTNGGSNLFAYNNVGLFYKSDKIQIVDLVNKTLSPLSYTLPSGTTLTSIIMNDKYISYVDSTGVNMFSPLPYSLFEETSYIPIIDKTIDNNKVIHSIDENLAYLKEDIADKGISVDMRDTNKEIEKLGILSGEAEASRASLTTLNENINQLRQLTTESGKEDASITTLNENIKQLIDLLTFKYKEGTTDKTISAATLLYSLVQSNIIPHSAF